MSQPPPWAIRIDLRRQGLEVAPGSGSAEATKALADEVMAARPEVERVVVYPTGWRPKPAAARSRYEVWTRERGGIWFQVSGPGVD